MTEIVISVHFGGYYLSDLAILRYAELKNIDLIPELVTKFTGQYYEFYVDGNKDKFFDQYEISRDDPALVQLVKEFNADTDLQHEIGHMDVIEFPDDKYWYISDYDGWEELHETTNSSQHKQFFGAGLL